MKKYVYGWFYGIYGIEYIPHGAWSDPEIRWHGNLYNYFDLEDNLWEYYKIECEENNVLPIEEKFNLWVKKNASLAREILSWLLPKGA